MFTYATIAGKNPHTIDMHLQNITEYAGFNKLPDNDKELLVVVFRNPNIPRSTTKAILEICEDKYKAKTIIYEEFHNNFLINLYVCWNMLYTSKKGYIFRAGCDQIFNKDSLVKLYDIIPQIEGKKITIQANTIESIEGLKRVGAFACTRHFKMDFGSNFDNFDYLAFEDFIKKINENIKEDLVDIDTALKIWGHPTPLDTTMGRINRCDGCSWLMSRNEYIQYGPLYPLVNGITGDVLNS